jgi:hypothetical protein
LNGQVLGPTHPEYELALIFGIVFAIVPFTVGFIAKRRQRDSAQPDMPRPLTSGAAQPPG